MTVDLYQLSGNTGNLSFFLTNAVNGTVYLTNVSGSFTNTSTFSNRYAIFTPANNFSGYASFDYYVTNNTTVAYFGPVTVSVVVSAVPITYGSVNTNVPPVFTNGTPASQTNFELNLLTVTNTATLLNTNLSLTYALTMTVDTNAMLLNGWPITYANVTNTAPVIDTNGIISWTPSEAQGPGVYIITTVAADSSSPPLLSSNSFSVTVNEVNLAPFWLTNVPSQTNYTIAATTALIVTNTATDVDLPPNPLTYQLIGPTGATINLTNGIITWTPSVVQLGVFTFTTIVTDTNAYALSNQSLSATNTFTVTVTAVSPPFVFTEPAQSVTGTSAQLNGMVTPNGLPTVAWFEWGTTTAYGNQTAPVSVGNQFSVVYTTNKLGGLTLNVPYHFRVVAFNSAGTNYGFDQILDEANVVAWGANYINQLNVPAGLSNATAIAGAYDHNLAIKNDSTAVAWGDNLFGQSVVPAGLNSNLVAAAGSEYSSMVLRSNGTVAAWGPNILNLTNVPPGLSNVVLIAGGNFSSLALRNNGSIAAWGANFFGLTTVPPGASNSVSVASGGFHSLAIKNDGTVIAWGDNSSGQTNIPAGLTNVVAVAAGSYHSLALRYDGTVIAWGENGAGQTNVPAGLTNVIAIAAGGFHSMALKSNGRIVTWGDNSSGQTSVPLNLTNAVAISCGYFHSLALTPQSLASLTNPIILNLTNGIAQTNTILPGGLTYYRVSVPTNADFATNLLLFALNSPLNIWFTTNTPPTIGNFNDSLLMAGVTNGISILSTTSAPTNIVSGSIYYLGVNNTNGVPVNYGIEVDFHLYTPTNPPPAQTNFVISSIVYTNITGTNGFLLTWFAPSNYLFQVQWSTLLVPATWTTFTNPPFVSYNPAVFTNPTNTQFNFFDNATQTGGTFGPSRFYRLILYTAPPAPTNTAPVFVGTPANQTINPLTTLTVTNAATDADVPTNTLTYALLNPPLGVVVNTNTGVITWTPTVTQAGTSNNIITVVTDNGTPNLSATNSFTVIVSPMPTNTAPVLPVQSARVINPLATLIVTNTATDADVPTNILTYILVNPPTGATINTNTGVITWTPTLAQAGTSNSIFTIVTDNGTPNLSATNFFAVIVNPVPTNTVSTNISIVFTKIGGTNGYLLTWFAPSNALFQVQWTGNLLPAAWQTFSNIVRYNTNFPASAGTAQFNFFDDGSQTGGFGPTRFYRLLLVPPPVVLSVTAPFAFTAPPTLATGVGMQLNGFATPNGTASAAWFEWGASTNYSARTKSVSVGTGYGVSWVTNPISGLIADQVYHSRLVVSNALGTAFGADQMFGAGTPVSWGFNFYGQTNVPAAASNIVALAEGAWFTLAVSNSGAIYGWGYNANGQTDPPPGVTNSIGVSAGDVFSAALAADGTVAEWFPNLTGLTNVPPGLSNVVSISAGSLHTLALKNDGIVVAWGSTFYVYGQTNVPPGLSNVVAVAGGQAFSLALKNDGTVVAWGDNSSGQTNVPPNLTNVVAIAAGSGHALVLLRDGTVLAWGGNGFGQTNIPSGLSNVVAIAAGSGHNLALKKDGSLVAWGANTWNETNLPPGLTNVFAISVGCNAEHNTVLKSALAINSPNAASNTPPEFTLLNGTKFFITPSYSNTVNNSATDNDLPAQTLTYTLTNSLAGTNLATINTNTGIITWTPTLAQAGKTNTLTAVVTDNGVPPMSATNKITVIVNAIPSISGITVATNGLKLTWLAPTNEQFNVQWTTNLTPPVVWTFLGGPITSTNGTFTFTDTNALFLTKFYELILLP